MQAFRSMGYGVWDSGFVVYGLGCRFLLQRLWKVSVLSESIPSKRLVTNPHHNASYENSNLHGNKAMAK